MTLTHMMMKMMNKMMIMVMMNKMVKMMMNKMIHRIVLFLIYMPTAASTWGLLGDLAAGMCIQSLCEGPVGLVVMAYQHIPTRHIPTRWEYDMMIRGGNVTLSYSHHIYYIYHYTYVWVICLSS